MINYTCTSCDKTFSSAIDFNTHLSLMTTTCNRLFKSKYNINHEGAQKLTDEQRHVVEPISRISYVCSICLRDVVDTKGSKRHTIICDIHRKTREVLQQFSRTK
jgi:DNA-directed RNA polymerase subunit RPC12/RpoP